MPEPQPDQSLRIRVVDGDERPVAGIPVALRIDLKSHPFDLAVRATDLHGVAVLHQLDRYLTPRNPNTRYQIALGIPLAASVQLPLDPAAPPAGLVQLTAPATGSVVVELHDPQGTPSTCAGTLELHAIPHTPDAAPDDAIGTRAFRFPIARGQVTIPWVGLGLLLVLTTHLGRGRRFARHTVIGPRRAGESKQITLRVDDQPTD